MFDSGMNFEKSTTFFCSIDEPEFGLLGGGFG